MRLTFYGRYAGRSLLRGGQRTLLAIFCIAAGVMAIVGLQLASSMVRLAITSNARAVNQGDLSVGLQSTPLQASDLDFFAGLKAQGIISGFTPLYNAGGILQLPDGTRHTVSVRVVDPSSFPLIGSSRLTNPPAASLAQVLNQTGSGVVASRLFDDLHTPLGSRLRVLATSGSLAQIELAGVAPTDNATWTGNTLAVSIDTWQAATKQPVAFQTVAVTTLDAGHTQQAGLAIRSQFPLANLRTTDDVLRQAERGVETTRKFLIVIGLIALLIGGVGIVNTMQVLLSRRRVEIAVLKTTGYRRRDLYLLFAIEAGLLGLAGGSSGALLGIGVAAGLRALFLRAFPLVLPFVVDPGTVLSGVVIGLATALIFGMLPIVRAASIRPQAVLRDLPAWQGAASLLQSIGLVVLLSILFCLLASIILRSAIWGIAAVYGAFAVLALVSLALGVILRLLSLLPVPDRYSLRFLLLVTLGVLLAVAVARLPTLRGVGTLLLGFALFGYLVVLLPGGWRVNMKLALRNIGRSRARTTTTLLALLIGVFTVGLILVLGQDLRANLGQAIADQLEYNVIAISTDADGSGVPQSLHGLPSLQRSRVSDYAPAPAVAVDGRPVTGLAAAGGPRAATRIRQQLRLLSGLQGYDVANGDMPEPIEITQGRNLDSADASSENVIVQDSLRQAPLGLALGSTVTLKRPNADTTATLSVVGFYRLTATGAGATFNLAPILGPQAAAAALSGDSPFRVFYLQVAPNQVAEATRRLQQAAPDAIVLNLDDFLTQFEQILNNILLMLTAIASLALLAGIIIVANAVALAMLERRRELGILKAVGYTSGRVLTGVLIENALTAGLGGLLGMAPVSLAVVFFNRQAGVSFSVGAPIAIAVVLGVVLLTLLTTTLVAAGAVRVRPLEVLRYE